MFSNSRNRLTETYPLMDALAVAVAVDRAQGFVKSKQGFLDPETNHYTHDNRITAQRTLRVMFDKEPEESIPGEFTEHRPTVYRPTDEDRAKAQEIFTYFDEILVLDKLGDDLTKVGRDGRVNDFNLILSQMFEKGEVGINKDLAMLVSLPNSRRVAAKREEMEEFHRTHRENGYISELRQRVKVTGFVKDIKLIPSAQVNLATVVTPEGKIAKFFMNEKLSIRADNLRETDITFTGTVKKQEVNDFTGCQETMFNRVKID